MSYLIKTSEFRAAALYTFALFMGAAFPTVILATIANRTVRDNICNHVIFLALIVFLMVQRRIVIRTGDWDNFDVKGRSLVPDKERLLAALNSFGFISVVTLISVMDNNVWPLWFGLCVLIAISAAVNMVQLFSSKKSMRDSQSEDAIKPRFVFGTLDTTTGAPVMPVTDVFKPVSAQEELLVSDLTNFFTGKDEQE